MDKIKLSFDEIAHKYDYQREQLIPCYHEFYNSIVTLVDKPNPGIDILDLGAGTGLLTSFLLKKYPDAHYTLVDFAEEMLLVARQRFDSKENIKYLTADYKSLPISGKFDIVASSLSIHHLSDSEKDTLYLNIFDALNPGGLFINGDLFLGRTNHTNEINQNVWFSKIDASSLSDEDRKAGYYRMTFDQPSSIEKTIESLEKTGFSDVDVFYKYFRFAVIRGTKK